VSGGTLRLKVITSTRVVVEADADGVTFPAHSANSGSSPATHRSLTTMRNRELAYRSGGPRPPPRGAERVRRGIFGPCGWRDRGHGHGARRRRGVAFRDDVDAARAAKAAAETALKSAAGKEFDRQHHCSKAPSHGSQWRSAADRTSVAPRAPERPRRADTDLNRQSQRSRVVSGQGRR